MSLPQPPLETLGAHFLRALHVFILALAPTSFSPEPRAPEPGALVPWLILTALLLAVWLYGAVRLALALQTGAARAAAALMWIAVAAALGAGLVYSGDQAPLLRGAPLVAVPLWASLAAAAAALAGRRSSSLGVAIGAAAAVLALGGVQLYRGVDLLSSPERTWWAALWLDPGHDRAASELARPLLRARRFDDARKIAERCLALHPDGCACLDLRAEVAIAARRTDAALADARAVAERCPVSGPSRALLAMALAQQGSSAEAEQQARLGLTQGGPPDQLHYALAIALERAGRYPEASVEAKAAVAAGAGRDARLFDAALGIVSGDFDGAVRALKPLVAADANDADAQYDLGLIAEKRGETTAAREGYQAALRADPQHRSARYNVALLAWRLGAREESQYHLAKFRESFADDPLTAQLTAQLAQPSPPK